MRFHSTGRAAAIVLICIVLLCKLIGVLYIPIMSLWPLILLALSASCAGRTDGGALITGGVLFTYGIMFMACEIVGWELMQIIWPCFLLGPALGLYRSHRITGSRAQLNESRVLLAICVLLMLGLVLPLRYIVAIVMILGGIAVFISIFLPKKPK